MERVLPLLTSDQQIGQQHSHPVDSLMPRQPGTLPRPRHHLPVDGDGLVPIPRTIWFHLLLMFILSVSLYDTLLIVQYSESIRSMECNPMGRWLIDLAAGDVDVFVRVKLAGTTVTLTSLALLWRLGSRKTFPVTTSVAAYQAGLFAYLTLA